MIDNWLSPILAAIEELSAVRQELVKVDDRLEEVSVRLHILFVPRCLPVQRL